jgi:hypothetical protein
MSFRLRSTRQKCETLFGLSGILLSLSEKKNSRVQMLSNQTAKIHGKTTRDVHLQLIAAKYLVKDVKFGLLLFFGVGRRPRPGHVRQTSVFRQPHFSINHFV